MLLFLRALMHDWGYEHTGIELLTDSSSAKSLIERRGLGKNRHLQTKFLWIQERLALKDFVLKKVATAKNLADLMTKALSAATIRQHLLSMSMSAAEEVSDKHRALLT